MTDVSAVERLLHESRRVEGLTLLVHRLPTCQSCAHEGRLESAVVRDDHEGTARFWCLRHYALHGRGVGPDTAKVLIETGGGASLSVPSDSVPVGYAWLIREFQLAVLPPHRLSFIGTTHVRRELRDRMQLQRVYPPGYAPDPTLMGQLEFALKYDGLNLEVLGAFFDRVDQELFERELTETVGRQPFGQYSRRLWFVYEWLTGRQLPVPDLTQGSYIPLLDPDQFYTGTVRRVRRQRINENLLGTRTFAPMVRRTETLAQFETKAIGNRVVEIVNRYDEDALKRAISYLYTKETRSSFGIEGERPNASRVERFIALLQAVPRLQALTKEALIELQNATVDPRFANSDYRDDQVYVAMALDLVRQRIEYIAPRPKDVPELMDGLLECLARLDEAQIDPVVQAAVISFGFVFIHPFSDGNGRLHRLLIHYILSRRGFTPRELIFPVSAVMEAKRNEYDACLETFSRPLMQLLDYDDEDGVVTVHGETARFYRYFDATRMAEDLFHWVVETVDSELQHELEFIVRFREARAAMAEVVDLPDRLANLFVRLCRQNGGRLSQRKRAEHFPMLTDDEVAALEEIVHGQLMAQPPAAKSEPAPSSGQDTSEAPTRAPKHTYRSPRKR
ncbi:MAG: Fic family protein [Myxococcaceae bacterium]